MHNGIMDVAQQMQRLGRDGDTILAHINPREMQALMNMGGRGSINPATGLPEFAPIDPLYYLSVNPQVMQQAKSATRAAGIQPGPEFQANMFRIAQDHYDAFGEAEGRAPDASLAPGPSTDFDAEFYAARNPDVVAAYGNDPTALKRHYLQFGVADTVFSGDQTQGRLGNPNQVVAPPEETFDGAFYAANNPDVVGVYGSAPDRLYRHFLDYGQAEGRLGKAPSTVDMPEGPGTGGGGGGGAGGGINLVAPPAIPDGRAYSPRVGGDTYQPVDYSGLDVTPEDTIDLLAEQGVGVRYYIMVLNQDGQMVKEYVPANTPGAIREVTGVYGSTGRGTGMHDFYPNELGFIPEELDVSGILGLDPE
jgi:hypothetical protein